MSLVKYSNTASMKNKWLSNSNSRLQSLRL